MTERHFYLFITAIKVENENNSWRRYRHVVHRFEWNRLTEGIEHKKEEDKKIRKDEKEHIFESERILDMATSHTHTQTSC